MKSSLAFILMLLIGTLCVAQPAPAPASQPDLSAAMTDLIAKLDAARQAALAAQAAIPPKPVPTPTFRVFGGTLAHESFWVDATGLIPPGVAPELCNITWVIADPSGTHDILHGFNAAHFCDHAGAYPIICSIDFPDGTGITAAGSWTMQADNRPTLYVDSVGGLNTNPGTPAAPLKGLPKALLTTTPQAPGVAGETIALYTGPAGGAPQIYPLSPSLTLSVDHLRITSYGPGPKPVIAWTGPAAGGGAMLTVSGNDDTIENVAFDSPAFASPMQAAATTQPFTSAIAKTALEGQCPDAIRIGGTNQTIRNCTFLNVGYGGNGNLNPVGVLAENNDFPLMTGLRGYAFWYQGSDWTIVGNHVANSTQEHVVRGGIGGSGTVQRINVSDNHFFNWNKGDIVLQTNVQYAVAYNNVIDHGGGIGTGPLGGDNTHGTVGLDAFTRYVRIEGNTINKSNIQVGGNSDHVLAVNNRITDGTFVVPAPDANFPSWTATNIAIDHNTVDLVTPTASLTPPAIIGRALFLLGNYKNFTFTNNLLVTQGNYVTGGYQSAPIFVNGANDPATLTIGGNVLPAAKYAGYFGNSNGAGAFDTLAQWNARPFVKTPDQQLNVTLDASGNPTDPAILAGAR